MWVRIAAALAAVAAVGAAVVILAGRGAFGRHEAPGAPGALARPAPSVAAEAVRQAASARALGAPASKQILFGDLHVHTTFSLDAFLFSLPLAVGEGAHPPADACDFARHCSALDFWSINDHAEGLTPAHWAETIASIRQCNEVGQRAASPDTVAFLGWEWTQVGTSPADHYGHKNVVLAGTGDGEIPARPIAASRFAAPPTLGRGAIALREGGRMHDLARLYTEIEDTPECPPGVPERELPRGCIEVAPTPAELFAKLDDWKLPALVIPHGTTWGLYTPQGSTWDKQLAGADYDPDRQTLIEVYSGHGSSEAFRAFRDVVFDASGAPACPEPTPDYLPTCWRAGELVRERCAAEGAPAAECEARAAEARGFAARAGAYPHMTVPGATWDEWLDAGQCRSCFLPAFNYRPGGSAQYLLALTRFGEPGGAPRRFRLGFIASSDNHFARPGTGYKQRHRLGMTESMTRGEPLPTVVPRGPEARSARGRAWDPENFLRGLDFGVADVERASSYLYTGGLVAVHANGRDRASIWDALSRREVYGTSGPRILLWFDLENAPGGAPRPMGSEVAMAEAPRFSVRAVGSFEQLPGCPDEAASALGPAGLERLCKGECYHPSDVRRPIERIEVVRIRPQRETGEAVAPLIEDPWRSFACAPDPAGCAVAFEDPEFAGAARDAVYYARALEGPAPLINAAGIRVEGGAPVRCPGPAGAQDDCLAPAQPRAWSSPIYVDFAPGAAAQALIPAADRGAGT